MSIGFNKTHSVVDSLPKGTTVESVVCLSREKTDDDIRSNEELENQGELTDKHEFVGIKE